eukprot:m.29888 g.29888  ORF g.29888 m.29888 type:complete len:274 (-) comp11982_c0_seq2:1319-2140(-)
MAGLVATAPCTILCLFAFVVASANDISLHAMAAKCSRQASRQAEEAIDTLINSHLQPDDMVPASCPLQQDRNIFKYHNRLRDLESSSHATCSSCGKAFTNVDFLDQHLHRRHSSQLLPSQANDTDTLLCLADYCDVLQCEVFDQPATVRVLAQRKSDCSDQSFKLAQQHCLEVVQQCSAGRLMEQRLRRRICSRLSCDFWEHLREDTRSLSPLEIAQFLFGCTCLMLSCVWFLALLNDDYSAEDTTDWLIHVLNLKAIVRRETALRTSSRQDF